jgi:PEP-CTERM motif
MSLEFRGVCTFPNCVAANSNVIPAFEGDSIMSRSLRIHANRLKVLGLSAFALSLTAYGAQALTELPVQNLTFTEFNSPSLAPKSLFTAANPVGWTGGGDLVSIDAPGTATETGGGGNSYPVYGPFANPPPGGNFIQADGNPQYESAFNQVIHGLTAGTEYSLSFWQAAGQQQGFSGATTEQWKVFFGTGSFAVHCNTNPCTVSTSGSITEDDTAIMDTPSQGTHGWELETMDFVATASTETLSFLAWGDGGSTTNLPPTVFLAGVNSPALPEPSTWAMMGLGFLGLAFVGRRRLVAKRVLATS